MIYEVYYQNIYTDKDCTLFAQLVKNLSEDDHIVLILTNRQVLSFEVLTSKYGLKDLIAFRTKQPITNLVHKENGRNLNIVVFSRKEIKHGIAI